MLMPTFTYTVCLLLSGLALTKVQIRVKKKKQLYNMDI